MIHIFKNITTQHYMAKNIIDLFLKHSHIRSNAAAFIQLIVILNKGKNMKIELFPFLNLAIKLNKKLSAML